MTDKTTAALKLAEEALEELHYSSGTVKAVTLYKHALAAIREALAEQNADEWYEKLLWGKREALAEQEPVAWVAEDVCEGQYIDGRTRKIWVECKEGIGMAIYAAPVSEKREWVELTDVELAEAFSDKGSADAGIRAVIAAFKEKNK